MKHRFVMMHQVPLGIDSVSSWLRDFSRFASFHPLMEKVDTIAPGHFKTHEYMALPLGIKFRFAYDVYVSYSEARQEVMYHAKPMGTKMAFSFLLQSQQGNSGTDVQETVQLSGFYPSVMSVGKIIKRSHLDVFANYARSGN